MRPNSAVVSRIPSVGAGIRSSPRADLAVKSPVIEPVDVFRGRDLEVVDVLPGPAVADQFSLEQRVEGLGQGIVIRVAGGADRGGRAGLSKTLGVADGDVLNALIAV